MNCIAELQPESFQIHLFIRVIELLLVAETTHEQTDTTTKIYEYLVGDDSGCLVLNTKKELKIDSTFEIKSGHTQALEGYLRLYSNDIQAASFDKPINTQNNRSFVFLERKQ